MGSLTILVIPQPCLSVLLQDDITQAIKCAKTVASQQGVKAWYVGTWEEETAGSFVLCSESFSGSSVILISAGTAGAFLYIVSFREFL